MKFFYSHAILNFLIESLKFYFHSTNVVSCDMLRVTLWHLKIFPLQMTQFQHKVLSQKSLPLKPRTFLLLQMMGRNGGNIYIYMLCAGCSVYIYYAFPMCTYFFRKITTTTTMKRVLCVCLAGIRTYNSNWIFMLLFLFGSCSWLLCIYISIYYILLFIVIENSFCT